MIRVFVIVLVVFLTAQAGSSGAQTETDEQKLARWALFKVKVEGRSAEADGRKITEEGRAFAISKDVLLTARHVTGSPSQWKNKGDGLLYVPDRTVKISAAKAYGPPPDLPKPYKELFVTPAATETVDAAKLTVPKFQARPFALSACTIDLRDPQSHKAVILRDGDLTKPQFVALKPDQYSSTEFGDVMVFLAGGDGSTRIQKGDSGSPVVNVKNEVVGLVSGITGEPVGSEVLVTLVPSFLQLLPVSTKVDCNPRVTRDELDALEEKLAESESRASLALHLIRHKYDIPADEIEAMLGQLEEHETIEARINSMIDDLGELVWQLKHKASPVGDTILEMSYERGLSLKAFSDRTHMCIEPLVERKFGDSTLKPTEIRYYTELENQIKLQRCPHTDHIGLKDSTKEGSYKFPLTADAKSLDLIEIENWNRFYYLRFGYTVDGKATILSRYLLRIKEDGEIESCNLFNTQRDIANFIDDQTKYKEVARPCSS